MYYEIKSTDIVHYGKPHDDAPGRGSGRYAWGSGKNPGNGVNTQNIKKRNKNSGNKSGTDIQIGKVRKNIATNNGVAQRSKFSTINNMKEVNNIAREHDGNCALCTYAMDLRERGKDVRANSRTDWMKQTKGLSGDTTSDDICKWYKTKDGQTPTYKKFPSRLHEVNIGGNVYDLQLRTGTDFNRWNSNIKSIMLKDGNGSYGHLFLDNVVADRNDKYYGYSIGGHDAFYKIENGQIIIYDGQNGFKYPYDEYIRHRMAEDPEDKYFMLPNGYLRTDDLDLADEENINKLTINATTPDSNYSPSYKTIDKIKTNIQYAPPYISDKKTIMSYTPPYQSNKAMKALNKASNTVKNTSISTGNKVSNTFDKIKQSFTDVKLNWQNKTSKLSLKDIMPKKK